MGNIEKEGTHYPILNASSPIEKVELSYRKIKVRLKKLSLANIASTESFFVNIRLLTLFCQTLWWINDILSCKHPCPMTEGKILTN